MKYIWVTHQAEVVVPSQSGVRLETCALMIGGKLEPNVPLSTPKYWSLSHSHNENLPGPIQVLFKIVARTATLRRKIGSQVRVPLFNTRMNRRNSSNTQRTYSDSDMGATRSTVE